MASRYLGDQREYYWRTETGRNFRSGVSCQFEYSPAVVVLGDDSGRRALDIIRGVV